MYGLIRTIILYFGHFLGTLLFRLNILLAETYCYNLSGRQDSNLRPSAPKAPARMKL